MQLSELQKEAALRQTEDAYEQRLNKSKITRWFTMMRPAFTEAEEYFVQKYLMNDAMVAQGMYQDEYGNCLMKIPCEDGSDSRTLWSCHTDSVHFKGGIQTVHFNPLDDKFSTPDGSCLGADDNSGTYVLTELLRQKVPGLYVFHRAEEVGGIGSRWIVNNCAEMLGRYDRAIAFDRKDVHSIITHQGSSRCCSEAFSKDLSEKLGMNHRSDPTGSFTDTANYDGIIPECTNMSVGYFSAHSSRETQLLDYLVRLKDAFASIDCESLVTDRNPNAPTEYSMGGYYGYGDTLLKPHKEARTSTGWSKQDDLKWKQDSKARKEKDKEISVGSEKEITADDLSIILDDMNGGDTKSEKDDVVEDEDNPDWEAFFGQLTE